MITNTSEKIYIQTMLTTSTYQQTPTGRPVPFARPWLATLLQRGCCCPRVPSLCCPGGDHHHRYIIIITIISFISSSSSWSSSYHHHLLQHFYCLSSSIVVSSARYCSCCDVGDVFVFDIVLVGETYVYVDNMPACFCHWFYFNDVKTEFAGL